MKKIFCKKTLSAFLAAVMILAMIPVGMISAVAADAGYSIDEETKTITITTAAGWNAVANTEAYAAYNFVLGDNIDFSVPDVDKPLFSSVAFAGTFDGKGFTISNFSAGTSSEKASIGGIIATTTVGRTDLDDNKLDLTLTTDDVVVKNLTIENATVYSSLNFGVLIGTLSADGIFENIKITNATVSGGTGSGAASGYVGGLVGYMTKDARVLANKCNVTGSITATRNVGGIVGGLENAERTYHNATTVIKNCDVNASLTSNNSYGRAGGIVGFWGDNAGYTFSSITIDSCYCSGTYRVSSKTDRMGAVAGTLRKCTTIIRNTVVDVSGLTYLLCAYGHNDGTYILTNVYSTATASTGLFNVATPTGTVTYQGENQDLVETLVSYDANGFINGVAGTYGYVGDMHAQVSNVVDGKYIIRFVMPAMTADMTDVKMTIVVKNGEEVVHTYEIDCTMWDYLTGYNGRTGFTTYTPDQYGAEKLLAGAIVGVPTGAAYDFEISTTFTVNGVEITSTAYGASVTAQGALVTE